MWTHIVTSKGIDPLDPGTIVYVVWYATEGGCFKEREHRVRKPSDLRAQVTSTLAEYNAAAEALAGDGVELGQPLPESKAEAVSDEVVARQAARQTLDAERALWLTDVAAFRTEQALADLPDDLRRRYLPEYGPIGGMFR